MTPIEGRTVVFVHGAWVTTQSWDPFRESFEAAGYTVHTPTWPYLQGRSAAELNRAPPRGFGGLTVTAIADHMQAFIETLPEPPLLVGHSFGGLVVQMLLDRGCGAAGVALNPVLIGGIVPGPVTLSAALPIFLRWNGWNRPYAFTRKRWGDRFANGAPQAQRDAAYDSFVIPAPGRIFFQAASWVGTFVSPRRRTQPLLITAGDKDWLVTPYLSRAAYEIQKRSPAPTDYKHFPGRSHFLIAEPGWDEVAAYVIDWADRRMAPVSRPSAQPPEPPILQDCMPAESVSPDRLPNPA